MANATATATASGTTGSTNAIITTATATATATGYGIGTFTVTVTGTLKITLTQVDNLQTVSLYGNIYFFCSNDPKNVTTVFNVMREDAVSVTVGNEIPFERKKTDPLPLKSNFIVNAKLWNRIDGALSSDQDQQICEGDAKFTVGENTIPNGRDIPPQGSRKINAAVTWP